MSSRMNRVEAFLFLARCLESGDRRGLRRDKLAEEIASGRPCWEHIVEIASESWMTLALYRELGEKGLLELLPGDLLEYFMYVQELNGARNRGILEHTGELARLLNQIGVEPLLLKGAGHLASGLYPDPAVRFMSDIDILVPGDRALECWRLLISAGYQTSPDHAHSCVDSLPNEEWPALWRAGRTGELEVHRLPEWSPTILSFPSLYAGAEPLELRGGAVRILSPTNRAIFTMAHSFVYHRLEFLPHASLRDLYDATLLLRQFDRRIDWSQVIDAFDRAGEMAALRAGCMIWRRFLAPDLPRAVGDPSPAWVYRLVSLLNFLSPRCARVHRQSRYHAAVLRVALSRTTEGKRLRREFCTPSVFVQKLRNAVRLYAGGLPEVKQR